MSTLPLTIVAVAIGLFWFLAGAIYSLWRHRPAHALAQLGACALFTHQAIVMIAWAGAAQGDWSYPSLPVSFRWLAEPASMLPTWFFDLSAWLAIALVMASMAVDAVQQYRGLEETEE